MIASGKRENGAEAGVGVEGRLQRKLEAEADREILGIQATMMHQIIDLEIIQSVDAVQLQNVNITHQTKAVVRIEISSQSMMRQQIL